MNGDLHSSRIESAAEALYRAELDRVQIRPVSAINPETSIADAYRIQSAVVARKVAAGASVIGAKIGLTSRAMQQAMQIDEPDYGTLLDDMSFANGCVLEAARFTDPRIEVELAFVLKRDLFGAGLSVQDVLAATEYVVPALELIAARSFRVDPETGRARTVVDTIADNGAAAGIVLGEPLSPGAVDLRWCGAILSRNGVIEETGLAAGVMNHPANGIVWLARRFAAHDIPLRAGQLVLAGSFTRPVTVAGGDEFAADYGDHGTISCRFD